jgi:hypothetical protein
MAKLSASEWAHRLWLLIRRLLSGANALHLWRMIWSFIWRHILQSIRRSSQDPKPPAPSLEPDHADASVSIQGPDLKVGILGKIRSSSCYGLREPAIGSLQTPMHAPPSAAHPYSTSVVSLSASDASDDEIISIRVDEPDHPPNESGDFIPRLPTAEKLTVVDTEMLRKTHLSPSSIHSNDSRESASQYLSGDGARHPALYSSHSSAKSIASATLNSRGISSQIFSVEQANGSRLSVIASPSFQADNDMAGRLSLRADSSESLAVADDIHPFVPTSVERYKRNRPR